MNSFFKLLFNLTVSEWKNKKLKTLLTLSGIVVAVFTIVLLVILTFSLKYGIVSELERFEPNQVIVTTTNVVGQGPPMGFSLLRESDIEYVKSLKEVDKVFERLTVVMPVTYNGDTKKISVSAVSTQEGVDKLIESKPFLGRFFNDNDKDKNVVLIGKKVYDDTFDDIKVNKNIYINGKKYKIIGVLEGSGSIVEDSMIFVPYDKFKKTFSLKGVSSMILNLKETVDVNAFIEKLKDKLNRRIGRDVVEVITPEQLKEFVDNILLLINILIISIASISIIVGGIGITNSLYSSVLQRKKEIGTMKAVGAKNYQVLLIFLVESISLSIIGVVLGFILASSLGFIIITLLSKFSPYNFIFYIPKTFVIIVFFGGVLLGTLAGLYPAYQAVKLPPTEALRYE